MENEKILNRDLFFDQLRAEVKRARRYQNFFSILGIKLFQLPGYEGSQVAGLRNCDLMLKNLLREELRESDILGNIENDQLAILAPYADLSSLERLRIRLEEVLKYCELKNKGYSAQIRPLCFPLDGTNADDLIGKMLEGKRLSLT